MTDDWPFFDFGLRKESVVNDLDLWGEAERVRGVYFVQAGQEGPVKIGWSEDVGRRFDALQSANYEELHIRLICGGMSRSGHQRLEKTLHRAFQYCRIRGEWFRASPALLKLISRPTLPAFRWFGFELEDGDFIQKRGLTKAQVQVRLARPASD